MKINSTKAAFGMIASLDALFLGFMYLPAAAKIPRPPEYHYFGVDSGLVLPQVEVFIPGGTLHAIPKPEVLQMARDLCYGFGGFTLSWTGDPDVVVVDASDMLVIRDKPMGYILKKDLPTINRSNTALYNG